MPTPVLQLLSQTHYVSNGVDTIYNFNFAGGYLDESHVRAYSRDALDVRTDIVITSANFVGPSTLQIPVVPENHVIVFYRSTPKNAPLVDFSDGSAFHEGALDTANKQAIFLAQETADYVGLSSEADLVDLATAAQEAVTASAASAAAAALSEAAAELAADEAEAAVEVFGEAAGAGLIGYDESISYAADTVGDKLREVLNPGNFDTVAEALAEAKATGRALRFDSSTTLNIPTDGTLQDIFDYCIQGRKGVVITCRIITGHQLIAGAVVRDGDYGYFKITSVDATVVVSPSWPAGTCALEGRRARMPVWSILLDCNDVVVGGNDGYNVAAIACRENSDIVIDPGCGAIDNGSTSHAGIIVARNSRCMADQSVFSGCNLHNVWVTHQSDGYFERCTLTDATVNNVFVSRGSRFYYTGSDLSGSGQAGILAYRSLLVGLPFGATDGPLFDGNGTYGILAQDSSWVICRDRAGSRPQFSNGANGVRLEGGSKGLVTGVDFTALTGQAVWALGATTLQAHLNTYDNIDGITIVATDGSVVDAHDSDFTACNQLVQANGGKVNVNSSTSDGSAAITVEAVAGGEVTMIGSDFQNAGTHAISCENGRVYAMSANISGAGGHAIRSIGGFVDATSVTGTGAALNGVSATFGAEVIVVTSNLSGALGTNGISSQSGSRVVANSCNAQKGGSPAASDVSIGTGGIITFNNGTGGLSTAANTVSAAGIIFQ